MEGMKNVISLVDDETQEHNAFCDLTHFGEELKERYALSDLQHYAVVSMYARWLQDFNYYTMAGFPDEED